MNRGCRTVFALLSGLAVICFVKEIVKDKTQRIIPAESWGNKALMYDDKINPDISPQQIMKNLEKGKYYSSTVLQERYEIPVKPIVDKKRYNHDVREYGKEIADDNAKQGLYSFVLKM